jgi:hypothetical protein
VGVGALSLADVASGAPAAEISVFPAPPLCGAAAIRSFGDWPGVAVGPEVCDVSGVAVTTSVLVGAPASIGSTIGGELAVVVVVVAGTLAGTELGSVETDVGEMLAGAGVTTSVAVLVRCSGA